jgi:predicted TPR repeat methyltransferase
VFYSLGEVKAAANDSEAASNWYEKAAAADPSWGKPIYRLALAAMKKGDAAGAAKLMAQVIAVDPASPEAALAKSSLESLNK